MPKGEKIGRDVLGKKDKMTAKESKKFEEWKAEREAEKKKKAKKTEAEELEGKKIEAKAPEEKEPSADQLAKQRAQEYEEMHRLKAEGKPVHVSEHRRRLPGETKAEKAEGEHEEEEEEELPSLLKPKKKVK